MTAIIDKCKQLTFELFLNEGRDTVAVFTQIADVLHVALGEQRGLEYVQLRHVKHLTQPEPALTTQGGINGQRI
jgi:hypothetical protein